ncbi:MAG TPA: cellulase family glycosylhydrolase [Anaerolineales bacterium]|nr:cellulase family glycosylhydrolase [Anaerolineales bacterium]
MTRRFNVFRMLVIGVIVFALLNMSSNIVSAAGKPSTPTPTSTPVTTPTSTAVPGVAGGWRTSGTQILNPSNQSFQISGVNWYGFETRDKVAHGMWTKDYKFILDEVKLYGFNTVRIPFSNEMWETNPAPSASKLSACSDCTGKKARDILALIINYAGSIGLHVILDNHRSGAGNSAEANGLWYTSSYPESAWINDWVNMQRWVHGVAQPGDTVTLNYYAADGFPVVMGYDLRNEPHTPSRTAYLAGATWGSGDGIDPAVNPNPNPFAPACVATSTCVDWRLAAERAGDRIFGEAAANGWDTPLIFVEGIGMYPSAGGNPANGPYDGTWWGGDLQGVNGNSTNPGAPVVFNSGGTSQSLGAPVLNKLVYSAHDYGPALFQQSWFNANTCYKSGCGPSSLVDVWYKFWAYLNVPGGINPTWPGHASYPWSNTGHTAYSVAPVYIGEFGTANADTDLTSTTRGSQGQWFTDMVAFVQSSRNNTPTNASGIAVSNLHFAYWSLNDEDAYAILGASYSGLENPKKVYSYLCYIESGPFAPPFGSGAGQCSSTGALPAPY